MNKFIALLLLLGAIGGFGLSAKTSYDVQDTTFTGAPVGEPRKVYVSRGSRIFYVAFGVCCSIGFLYFVARVRRDDLR
jgi:hypothetical protein